MEALVSTIWLEEWGGDSDDYTGVLVTCPLPNSRRPSRAYAGLDACHDSPSHSLIVNGEASDQQPRSSSKRQFTMCIKGLDFDEDIARKLITFIELNRILGARLFYFYVFSVSENVLRALRMYERRNVVRLFNLTLPGQLPNDKLTRRKFLEQNVWIKRRMELIPYNHCFYDNLYESEYVVPIDIDETIIPSRRKEWSMVLLEEKRKLGRQFKEFASYAVRNAYFFLELQNHTQLESINLNNSSNNNNSTVGNARYSNVIDQNDNLIKFTKEDHSNYLDTVRSAHISPEGDSIKSFVSTKRALTVHNHYALSTLNPNAKRAHHLDPRQILKHHHRLCDDRHLDCDSLMKSAVIDKSALKFTHELESNIEKSLLDLQAHRM